MYEHQDIIIRGVCGISLKAKMALVIIADHANNEAKAWPSLERIAQLGCMSRRSAVNAIVELTSKKLIWKNPTRTHNVYTINITECKRCTVKNKDIVQDVHFSECNTCTDRVQKTSTQSATRAPEATKKQPTKQPYKQPGQYEDVPYLDNEVVGSKDSEATMPFIHPKDIVAICKERGWDLTKIKERDHDEIRSGEYAPF